MTLDEAIRHAEEVAEIQEAEVLKYNYCRGMPDVEKTVKNCKECAADHRQLAEWLTELKDLREENKVLTSECDRLIKEKGELLNKVSGGDVLRICRLEEQLQVELDNSHCLEIEMKEAKRLLKVAIEDLESIYRKLGDNCEPMPDCGECPYIPSNQGCYCKWRYANEALKLIGEDEE